MGRHLLLAATRPVDDADHAYNDWYDETHLSEVLKLEGFEAAQRFSVSAVMMPGAGPVYPYLAIYEIETDDIDATLAGLRAALPAMTISDTLDPRAMSVVAFRPIGERVSAGAAVADGTGVIDVFEAMGTARAMRRLRPDPIDDDAVERLIWAATRASSANNTQPWDFVVVRNDEQRRRIAEVIGPVGDKLESRYASADEGVRRRVHEASELARNIADVPTLVFVCGTNRYPAARPKVEWMYSAVFGAAQNLLVAARALGLGAAYTTLHDAGEQAIKDILGIPDDRTLAVTIAVGHPARPFGPVSRRPVEEVLHLEKW
jgi:nitroreductase